ncbi:MAG: SCO family protein [Armatimonadetes bacterium]|nr:MAG: SCO family protein [Armatimonadota bacterium]
MIRLVTFGWAVAILMVSCAAETSGGSPQASLGPRDTSLTREIGGDSVLGTKVAGVILPDVSNDGAPFEVIADADGILVVYFGYTSCPDVCPTTMADLRQALVEMGDTADRVSVAMITVDPDRDVDETLTSYVQYFVPGAHALRTRDDDVLRDAADAFRADYSVTKVPDGRVEVAHSPWLYAVDDEGILRAVWAFGAEPEAIAAELTSLLSD